MKDLTASGVPEFRPGRALTDSRLRGLFAAIGVAVGSLFPFLSLFLADRGLSPARIGFVIAAMATAGALANPLWGRLADYVGDPARMLRVSALLSVLAVAVFAASGSSYWLVLFSATILATTRAPVEALADSIAIRSLGQRAQDFYGRIRLWSSIGFAASLVVWGFVLRYSGLSVILGGYAASMIVVWWRADTFGHTGHLPAIVSNRAHARLGGVGGVYAIFLVGVLLLGTAIGAASTFFPLWITGAGGSLSLVAVAGILGAIAEIPVMLWAGAVRRRFGAKGVFLLGGSAYVLTLLIWAQGPDPRVGAAMSVVRGAGFGLLYVGAVTSATWLLSPAALSTGQSLLQMTLMGLGPALGSSVGGVVFEALGAPSLFALAALSLALGVAVIVVVLSPDFRRS